MENRSIILPCVRIGVKVRIQYARSERSVDHPKCRLASDGRAFGPGSSAGRVSFFFFGPVDSQAKPWYIHRSPTRHFFSGLPSHASPILWLGGILGQNAINPPTVCKSSIPLYLYDG